MRFNPLLLWLGLFLMASCSHKYSSDTLDLSFYQWNQWADEEANRSGEGQFNPPSCGWEVLHRGIGTLVRIPASLKDYAGVSWYHCRFTLPENWEEHEIALLFEGAGPMVEVYLNEELVGREGPAAGPFEIDVTERIFYTRDNHLAVRINDTGGTGGITGNILVRASENLQQDK